MEAVVLAAGEGTRMRPLTTTRPKVMLPVAGRPLLEHVVRAAARAGVTRCHFVVHYHSDAVRAHFGDGSAHGVEIVYHEQGEPNGTGHALAAVQPAPTEPFFLLSGDTLVDATDLARLLDRHTESGLSVLGAVEVEDARAYGALEVDGDRLVQIHEKREDPPSSLINAGTYLLTPEVAAAAGRLEPSPRGELELTDALEQVAGGSGVTVVPLATWRDVGRPWDLLDATEAWLDAQDDAAYWVVEGEVEPGAVLHGNVRVEAGAVVQAGTYIEGPVVIQSDARVGPMAYLRGRTVIGRRCHIGAHTEIKNSLVFDDANVPHLNYVGDSVIGSGANLGAGTKVANLRHDKADVPVHVKPGQKMDSKRRKMGVVIGDDVKTGINVSLDCGTVVGTGALLAPGQSFRGHLEGGRIHWGDGRVTMRKGST